MLTLGRMTNEGCTNEPMTGRVQMRDKLIEIKMAEPKEGRSGGRYGHRRNQIADGVKPKAMWDPQAMYFGQGAVYGYPMIPPYYAHGIGNGYNMAPSYFVPPAPVSSSAYCYPTYGISTVTTHNSMSDPPIFAEAVPMGVVAPMPYDPVVQTPTMVGAAVMQSSVSGISLMRDGEVTQVGMTTKPLNPTGGY